MKIYSEVFKKWSKILELYQKKDDTFASKLFFNFDDGYIYFGYDMGRGKMKFFFDLDNSEKPKNFFISTVDFLNVITQFDDITMNSEGIFIHDKDKFKIPILTDEDDRIDTKLFADLDFINVPKAIFPEIEKALGFINPADANMNFHNVFIKNNYIFSMSSTLPLYESKIDFSQDLAVELSTASLILKIGSIGEGCKLSQNTNTAVVKSVDDEIELIIPNSYTTEFPEIRTDEFISSYNHSTNVIINKDILMNALQFIKIYLNVSNNGKFSIICDSDVLLKVEEDDLHIEKHIPYVSASDEIKEFNFELPGFKLESALKVLTGENVTIKLPTDSQQSLVDLSCDDTRHTIIARFAPK